MRTSNYHKKIEISKKTKMRLLVALIGVVAAAVIFFFAYFHVDTVEVMGSSYYSEDEIKSMVLKGPLAKNSVLAPMLYSKENTEEISFVEAVDVSQVNNHTIIISVKEIQPVGCFKYLDCFVYFDRQGIITASSVERNMRVPYFEGIAIDQIAFGDKVPIPDESMLNTSVSLSRIFAKNDEIPDHIIIDENGNITLTYEGITAQLGQDKYLEDKMTRLIAILPKIKGQRGILHLENVTDDKKVITFEREMTAEELAELETQESNGSSDEGGSDSNLDSGTGYDSGESDSSLDSGNSYDSGEADSGYDSDSSSSEKEDSSQNVDSGSDSDSGYDSGYNSSYDSDSGYDSSGYDSSGQ